MQDENRSPQQILDDLCDQHGVKKFDIDANVSLVGWQKLVQSICDFNSNTKVNKKGRKANPDTLLFDVRRLYEAKTDFSRFDVAYKENGECIKNNPLPDLLQKQIYADIADSMTKKYETEITVDKVRGILSNSYNKKRIQDLKKQEIKNLEDDPCDPDEIFQSIQEK
jgi:type II secretory ATPase GspE/PulE/Tfp pilus assembly ATPase PilB-like protein